MILTVLRIILSCHHIMVLVKILHIGCSINLIVIIFDTWIMSWVFLGSKFLLIWMDNKVIICWILIEIIGDLVSLLVVILILIIMFQIIHSQHVMIYHGWVMMVNMVLLIKYISNIHIVSQIIIRQLILIEKLLIVIFFLFNIICILIRVSFLKIHLFIWAFDLLSFT